MNSAPKLVSVTKLTNNDWANLYQLDYTVGKNKISHFVASRREINVDNLNKELYHHNYDSLYNLSIKHYR